jgi:hypothetical protein
MPQQLARVVGLSLVALALAGSAATAGDKGRYKKEGDLCVWVADDNGPNQCTPRVVGHFKKVGTGCVWDTKQNGADQCRPKGRFKKDGENCTWTADDNGPDQCNPRQPR